MSEKIKSIIAASIAVKQQLLQSESTIEKLNTVADVMTKVFSAGNKILFCGNGGSAADAQHLAAEFTGRFYSDRAPLPAEALHVNTSFLTAVANDYSFDEIYERAVKAHGKTGDMLVAISTSGNSKNCILAMQEAKRRGMLVVAFTGATGGKMATDCDYIFNIPSTDTPRIQESHILIGHILCELVEENLMKSKFI